jgi:hypothetical protein
MLAINKLKNTKKITPNFVNIFISSILVLHGFLCSIALKRLAVTLILRVSVAIPVSIALPYLGLATELVLTSEPNIGGDVRHHPHPL